MDHSAHRIESQCRPAKSGHRGEYDVEAEQFAKLTADLIPHGVKAVGGCCGTTPAFIKAIHEAFEGKKILQAESEYSSRCLYTRKDDHHRPAEDHR